MFLPFIYNLPRKFRNEQKKERNYKKISLQKNIFFNFHGSCCHFEKTLGPNLNVILIVRNNYIRYIYYLTLYIYYVTYYIYYVLYIFNEYIYYVLNIKRKVFIIRYTYYSFCFLSVFELYFRFSYSRTFRSLPSVFLCPSWDLLLPPYWLDALKMEKEMGSGCSPFLLPFLTVEPVARTNGLFGGF